MKNSVSERVRGFVYLMGGVLTYITWIIGIFLSEFIEWIILLIIIVFLTCSLFVLKKVSEHLLNEITLVITGKYPKTSEKEAINITNLASISLGMGLAFISYGLSLVFSSHLVMNLRLLFICMSIAPALVCLSMFLEKSARKRLGDP